MDKLINWIFLGVIVVILYLVFFKKKTSNTPTLEPTSNNQTDLSKLATCLKSKGAKFYGASWCPHCQHQLSLFGTSAHLLPYIECSNSTHELKKECQDAGVNAFPTWIFADGTKRSGEIPINILKQITGC